MRLIEAVRAGDRREALLSLADILAAVLEGESDEVRVEALSRELRIVLKELADLPAQMGGSLDDALAARRQAKQAADG